MKRILLSLLLLLATASWGLAQSTNYSTSFNVDAGNPGGLNTTDNNNTSGYTTQIPGSQSSNLWSGSISLPFSFDFYGQTFNSVRVTPTGLVTFNNSPGTAPSGDNENLPSLKLPDNTIAALWDEFTTNPPTPSNAEVSTRTFGSAPNRQFWIRWDQMEYGNITNTSFATANFACVLEESTNNIYVVDMDFASGIDLSATVGVQKNATTAKQIGGASTDFHCEQSGTNCFTTGSPSSNSYYEFSPFIQYPFDLEALALTEPDRCLADTNNAPVSLQITNKGTNPASGFQVSYQVNTQTPVTETVTQTLQPGDSLTYSFSNKASLGTGQQFNITAWTELGSDGNKNNDTISVQVKPLVDIVDQFIGFEAGGTGNSPLFDTLSVQTGSKGPVIEFTPQAANNTPLGMGMLGVTGGPSNTSDYVTPGSSGDPWSVNQAYRIASRFCVDAAAASDLRMQFDLRQTFANNKNNAFFRVLAGDTQVDTTFQPKTQSTDPWQTRQFDLSAYTGQAFQLTLETRNRNAKVPNGNDAAFVDNMIVYEPSPQDAAIAEIIGPAPYSCGDTSTAITVALANNGTSSISNVPVEVRLSGIVQDTLTATYSGPLAAGAQDTLMLGNLDLSTGDTLRIHALANLSGDGQNWNDERRATRVLRATPAAPNLNLQDTTICGPSLTLLVGDNPGPNRALQWYPTSNADSLLAQDSIFKTPVLQDTTTYYAATQDINKFEVGPNSKNFGSNSSGSAFDEGIVFDVLDYCRLDSVRIYPDGVGTVNIRLLNQTGNVVASRSYQFNVSVSDTLVPVGFELLPGSNYELDAVGSSVSGLFSTTNNTNYPYVAPNFIELSNSDGQFTSLLKFFYDWHLSQRSCPSVPLPITVNVNSTPDIDLGPSDTLVCQSLQLDATDPLATSYQWSNGSTNGQIIAVQTGKYKVVANGEGTCSDSDSINLTRPPQPQVDLPDTVKACGSYKLDVQQPFVTYNWSTGATGPSITVTDSGTYSVSLQNVCGISAEDSTYAAIEPGPVFDLGPDSTVCNTDIVILDPGLGQDFIYDWSTGSSNAAISVSHPNPGANTIDTQKVSVGISQGGCTAKDSVKLTFVPQPDINLPPDTNFCSSYTIDAGTTVGNSQYQWNTGDTTQKITVTQGGTYRVNVTSAIGCAASDSIVLTQQPTFNVDLGPDQQLCEDYTKISSNLGPSYQHKWSNGSTDTLIYAAQSGYYWVDVTNNAGCTVRDSIFVALNDAPQVDLGPDRTVCGGTTLDAGYPAASFAWTTGQLSRTIQVSSSGQYGVAVNFGCGASDSDTVQLNVASQPQVNLGPPDTLFCDQGQLAAGTTPAATYIWSTGQTGNTITVSESGPYFVRGVTGNGTCIRRDTIFVSVEPTPSGSVQIADTLVDSTDYLIQANVTPYASSYFWNFGDDAAPQQTTSGDGPHVVRYTDTGTKTISVELSNLECTSTITKDITVIDSFPEDDDDTIDTRLATTLADAALTLAPNPSDGSFQYRLELPAVMPARVAIYDLSGKAVYRDEYLAKRTNHKRLNLNELGNGVYFLRVATPQGILTKRLMIQRR